MLGRVTFVACANNSGGPAWSSDTPGRAIGVRVLGPGSLVSVASDQTRSQVGDAFEQFGPAQLRRHHNRLACFIHAMYGKDILCQIDSNGYDGRDFPSRTS